MFADAGLPFIPGREKVPNSSGALRLGELARDRGLYEQLHPRLFDAYWARGRDLGDQRVLLDEGEAVGLGADEIEAALSNPSYQQRIDEQTGGAMRLGVTGVPAWVIDARLLVPGAQPYEVFDRAMAQLEYEPVS